MLEGIDEENTLELFIQEGLNENEIILVNPYNFKTIKKQYLI